MLAEFNMKESSVALDESALCHAISNSGASAIDDFYESRNSIIQWAYQHPFSLETSLRANLLLIIFSAAETYFRKIIADSLSLCPIAAESAAQQQIPFGAISSFGIGNLGLVFSDTKGLTSSGEILQRTRNLLGLNIVKTSSTGVAIEQFERICTFRHCIVHSSGELLYNNRRELQIKTPGRINVIFDDKAFQDVVQIVVNAVRAYNNFVANEILQRWFTSGYLIGKWGKDKKSFSSFCNLFISHQDALLEQSPSELYKKFQRKMKKDNS